MTAVQPPDFDPLTGHHKYQRLRHLSGGACGFVVLALDKSSGDLVKNMIYLAYELYLATS